MVEPFGGQDKDEAFGKRPAQTIEGTATEVSIEPGPAEAKAEAPASEPARDEGRLSLENEAQPSEPQAAEPAPKVKKGPPPRTSPAELKSLFTHFAAGLLGGLAAIMAMTLFELPGRQAQAPDLSAIDQRLAKLESEGPPQADTSAIATLDQRVKALEDRKPEPQADIAGLTLRVGKLETSIASLAQTGEAGGSVADAAALDGKLAEFEQKLDTKTEQALTSQDEAHGKSVEAIEAEIAALKGKFGALAEAKLGDGDGSAGPELAAIEQRIGKIEAILPKLAEAVEEGNASAQSGTAAIAFANLREAVDAGRSYSAELDALNAVAPDLGDLGMLPSRAEAGIPALPALADALKQAEAQSPATAAPAPNASFFDSLIASATSAVQVKRLDAPDAATGPDATLARAEADIAKGDLTAAVQAVEALPEPAREGLSRWLVDAHARLSADATLAELEGNLLASLGGKTGEAKP